MQPILYDVIGGVTPVSLNVPEVLPHLNTGAVNVVEAPSLAAEQLQWASKLDTINGDVSAMALGALAFSSRRLAGLAEDQRKIVLETGRTAAKALTKRIRAEDDAAFARLKSKMTVVELSDGEKSKWQAVFQRTRARLKQGVFPPDLVDKLEALAK
jgi:TRAP-type C4-dicarboxylate transport system substrate-binding protein